MEQQANQDQPNYYGISDIIKGEGPPMVSEKKKVYKIKYLLEFQTKNPIRLSLFPMCQNEIEQIMKAMLNAAEVIQEIEGEYTLVGKRKKKLERAVES